MRWTIAQVAGALDTRPGAGLDPVARVAGVSIDSRAIRPGELFFAIHGPRHDGHTFVADVMEGGALAAVAAQERLAEIARPDVGIVTRVSPAHLEFFSSVDEIALAKRELIEGLNGRESTAVLNADDPRVAAFGTFAPGRVLTYGIEKPAFFTAEAIEDRGALGSAFDYVSPEGRVRLELALPGRHVIANALASLAAASVWGIGAAEAQSG